MKNVISVAAIAVLSLSASVAFSCDKNPPPNCSCKNGSWVNNTTNQTWNSTTNSYNTTNAGGSAKSSSNATGGSATIASGAVQNTVAGGSATIAKGAVTNTNGQTQTANGGAVTNSGNSSIAAGAVQNTVAGGSVSGSGNSTNTQKTVAGNNNGNLSNVGNASIAAGAVQSSTASASNANGNGDNANNTTIETTYKAAKIPVNTAYSAGLTSGLDTCLGSVSAGAQTAVLGLTFGTTKVDNNCVQIKRTHLVTEFSREAGCQYMLDHIPDAAAAFAKVGAKCVPEVIVTPAPEVVVTPVPDAPVAEPVPFVTPAPKVHE